MLRIELYSTDVFFLFFFQNEKNKKRAGAKCVRLILSFLIIFQLVDETKPFDLELFCLQCWKVANYLKVSIALLTYKTLAVKIKKSGYQNKSFKIKTDVMC